MLPRHHLLQVIPNRANTALGRLQNLIWQESQPLEVKVSEARPEHLSYAEAVKLPLKLTHPHTSWGRLFDQRWCRLEIPQRKGTWWLHWMDQGEATLYIDGKPYFGFDVAHHHCRLPAGAQEVWIESNCIQSAIWHPDANGMKTGSYFEGATLCKRNDEAWNAYHDLKCLLDLFTDQRSRENPNAPSSTSSFGLLPQMESYSPVLRQMLRMLDDAVDALDLSGVAEMRKKLADLYNHLHVDKTFMRCILTGHAHIDLVWIWPERMGELKAVHTFATANRLMEEYPEFRFAYSQPASYEAVKRRAPKLYDQVKRRIRSGKWQATGGMYVESDTIFACGEALAKSFILGQKGFIELNGAPSKLTWLPDVFGYSAVLPQLMRQTGVEYFFTTKMTWNAINRFPLSSFVWRGNDGSEVVAHVIQQCGYVTNMSLRDVRAPMMGHMQGDIHPEYLLPTGYGDGGGGPTDEMCERARRLGSLSGMPEIAWDHPEPFFERLNVIKHQLPVHQGECYLEYHRGTYTTHGDLKAAFRSLERALQIVEAAAATAEKQIDTEHRWKRLVFSQFHDYIPGSSVWDVYLEGVPELRGLAEASIQEAEKLLASKKGTMCAFNPHGIPVQAWVAHPKTGDAAFLKIPALSSVEFEEADEVPEAVTVKGREVSNGLASFELSDAGFLTRIEWNGAEVPLKDPAGRLFIYPDFPANFDAWDIDRQALSIGTLCDSKPTIKPTKTGRHRAGFSVTRRIGKQSQATVHFELEAGSDLVHIRVELDWNEPGHLLKLSFPTRYAATNARFGCTYGSVLRPQVSNGPVAEAMWEVPFSRHLEIFDEGEREGLCLLTEAKYGATVRDGEIGLTLVRSARVTGFDGHSHAWPTHLTRLENLDQHSDLGAHSIRLAIGHYSIGAPREHQPASLAETLFTPPLCYVGETLTSPLISIEGGETVATSWAKPYQRDGWILRLHETSGSRGSLVLNLAEGWQCSKGDLSEQVFEPLEDGHLDFEPYRILTVRIFKNG